MTILADFTIILQQQGRAVNSLILKIFVVVEYSKFIECKNHPR